MIGQPLKKLGNVRLVEVMTCALRGRQPMSVKEIQGLLWDQNVWTSSRDVFSALKSAPGKAAFGRYHGKAANGAPYVFYYLKGNGHGPRGVRHG